MLLIGARIYQIREIEAEGIKNFDVFDNMYFVMYREDNIIEVYTIDKYIYLSYKMRLPLYEDFSNY